MNLCRTIPYCTYFDRFHQTLPSINAELTLVRNETLNAWDQQLLTKLAMNALIPLGIRMPPDTTTVFVYFSFDSIIPEKNFPTLFLGCIATDLGK